MDVLRFIWRSVRRKPQRLRGLALFSVVATLGLLTCLVSIRVLAARNVPEVAHLLGTLDVVILLLSGTFLAQILVGALNFEILRLQAISEDPPPSDGRSAPRSPRRGNTSNFRLVHPLRIVRRTLAPPTLVALQGASPLPSGVTSG